jgi:hypothetical protein
MDPAAPIKKPEVDPIARSVSKPDAFTKPASFNSKTAAKQTRVRTMDWKRGKGRPRKRPFDYRAVKFF